MCVRALLNGMGAMAGVISGFDKGKCAALVVVEMTSFGCTASGTKKGQSFHKPGIVMERN